MVLLGIYAQLVLVVPRVLVLILQAILIIVRLLGSNALPIYQFVLIACVLVYSQITTTVVLLGIYVQLGLAAPRVLALILQAILIIVQLLDSNALHLYRSVSIACALCKGLKYHIKEFKYISSSFELNLNKISVY